MLLETLHLNSLLIQALNSPVPPDAAPLQQKGISSLDIKRTCRLLEEALTQRYLLGELSFEQYSAPIARWQRNRDDLCQQLEW